MREMVVLSDKLAEAVPFTVMVIIEGCTIALTIMAKTAMTGGMSPFVFVDRTTTLHLSSLFALLLPGFNRDSYSSKPCILGLSYSSPIVVCAMGLLIPAISFLLGIILRTRKLEWRSSCIRAKIIGTLISIMGAIVVELYMGPVIRKTSSSSSHLLRAIPRLFVFTSTTEHWVLGGLLLAASSVSVSMWNVIQLGTVKQYPQVIKVASFYSLAGTIQCTIFSLIVERKLSAWKLKLNMELLLIVLTAIFVSIIRSSVHITCTSMKGPFYVPLFKPFGIVFATFFGITFFANSLHYGSVKGSVLAGMGYYTVMWGQTREDEKRKDQDDESIDSDMKVPLLQEETQV